MKTKCNACADRHTYFLDPPCRTCRHEHADGTEDNFRPWIEQDAAYALLAAAERVSRECFAGGDGVEAKREFYEAIANAKGKP